MSTTIDNSLLNSLNGVDNNLSTNAISATSSNELTQDDFLEIMLAQLTSQDPSNPSDTAELVSQMTDYSMLSSIQGISEQLSSLSESLLSSLTSQATSYLGQQVMVSSSVGELSPDSDLSGNVTLTEPVEGLTVRIYDSSGQQVHSLSLGDQDAGDIGFSWDGTTSDGYAEPGIYSVIAEGVHDGSSKAYSTSMMLTVESVGMNANSGVYLSDGSEISASEIQRIA